MTATAGGILFGVAYVLTGRLGLSIGVHFGGGVAWPAIMQQQLPFRFTFPSLLVAEPLESTFAGIIQLWVVQVFTGIILVGLWVRLTHGGITVTDRFWQTE